MIELKFSGMCKDCKVAELELEDTSWYEYDDEQKTWDVHCIHEDACNKWAGHITIAKEIKE